MKIAIMILLSAASFFLGLSVSAGYPALPKNSSQLKVAVYDNGLKTKFRTADNIYNALRTAPGIKAEMIDNLKSDTLKKYDAVIIATIVKLAKKGRGCSRNQQCQTNGIAS